MDGRYLAAASDLVVDDFTVIEALHRVRAVTDHTHLPVSSVKPVLRVDETLFLLSGLNLPDDDTEETNAEH